MHTQGTRHPSAYFPPSCCSPTAPAPTSSSLPGAHCLEPLLSLLLPQPLQDQLSPSGVRSCHPCARNSHLDQRPHVGKVGVHGSSMGEVLVHPLHQLSEAAESQSLCAGRRDITAAARALQLLQQQPPSRKLTLAPGWAPGSQAASQTNGILFHTSRHSTAKGHHPPGTGQGKQSRATHSPSSRMTRRGASRSHIPCT